MRIQSIDLDKKINNTTILYSKFSKFKQNKKFNNIFVIGEYDKSKTNVLLIGGQHGTENGAPWALLNFFKNHQYEKYNTLNICCIPLLNPTSFNSANRDISKNDDIFILKNLNYFNNFDYIFSFHEDHNSKEKTFYLYYIDVQNRIKNITEIKNNIENIGLSVDNRISFPDENGVLFNKYSDFPEEWIIGNNSSFIRSEISGKMSFDEKCKYHLDIMNILLSNIS